MQNYGEEWEDLQYVVSRFMLNLERVIRLLEIPRIIQAGDGAYENLEIPQLELVADGISKLNLDTVYGDEVYRASVVLLHATLEDALREIARLKLSKCDAEVLNNIPLAGVSPTGRPQKFSLGELDKHRGRNIDELIKESVDQYLDKTSFNSSNDIASIFEGKLKFDISSVREYFPILDEMISRRHQIVHRADRENTAGVWELATIDEKDVFTWTIKVCTFIVELVLIGDSPDIQEEVRQLPEYVELKHFVSIFNELE